MLPLARVRVLLGAVAIAGLLAGTALGWAVKPVPVASPPAPAPPSALIADALATLEDLETLSAGVVEIMDDMIGGNVSSTALEGVRDSMQEIRAGLSDAKSQVAQLQR